MPHNKYTTSVLRAQEQSRKVQQSRFLKVTNLLNNYHSIEQMDGTKEEKAWAKKRLYAEIHNATLNLNKDTQRLVRKALKSRRDWEDIKEQLAS